MAPSSRHSLFFISVYAVTSILNYGFGVALGWLFTPAQFGVLGVAQSILLLLAMVVGAGFAWTTTHEMAANGVTADTSRRFRSALAANLILGILLGGGLWLGQRTGIIPLGTAYNQIIPLTGLVVVLLAVRAVFNGAARGLYKFTPVGINLIGEVTAKTVIGLALVIGGAGAEGVMAAFAAGAFLSLLHSVWILRHTGWWKGSGWVEAGVFTSSAPLFLGMVSTALMTNLDVLGIKFYSPAAMSDLAAGYYQAAAILARAPVYIAQALALVTFSYAAGAKSEFQTHQLELDNQFFTSALKAWHRLLLPAALTMIAAPRTVLMLFFPEMYLPIAPILQVLAAGGALLGLVTLLNSVFQASGARQQGALATLAGIIVQMALLAWLTPLVGGMGAAISLIGAGITTLIWMAASMKLSLVQFTSAWKGPLRRWRSNLLPHLGLTASLLIFPASDRMTAIGSLLLAGIVYSGLLFIPTQTEANPPANASQALSRFMRVILGG